LFKGGESFIRPLQDIYKADNQIIARALYLLSTNLPNNSIHYEHVCFLQFLRRKVTGDPSFVMQISNYVLFDRSIANVGSAIGIRTGILPKELQVAIS
jgi:hypothetical protein